jgi:tetratricopeptide (TPR) repeat protein
MLRFVLALAGVLGLAAPAHADGLWYIYALRQQECDSYGNEPEVSIRGCSMIIRSNNVTGERRAVAYRRRGDHHVTAENYDRALQDYTAAIDLNADLSIAYFRRAELLLERGEYDGALSDYSQYVRLEPDRIAGHLGRCRALTAAGRDLDRARIDCDAALERAAQTEHVALVHGERGYLGLRAGAYEAAWADYDAALNLEPSEPRHLYGRGLAAQHLGRAEEAERDLADAVRMAPRVAQVFSGLSNAP